MNKNRIKKFFIISMALVLIFSSFPPIETQAAIPVVEDGMPTSNTNKYKITEFGTYEYYLRENWDVKVDGITKGKMALFVPQGSNSNLGRTMAHKSTLQQWGSAFNGNPDYVNDEISRKATLIERFNDGKFFNRYYSVYIAQYSGAKLVTKSGTGGTGYLEVTTTPFPTITKFQAPIEVTQNTNFDVTFSGIEYNPYASNVSYKILVNGSPKATGNLSAAQLGANNSPTTNGSFSNKKESIQISGTGTYKVELQLTDAVQRTTKSTISINVKASTPKPVGKPFLEIEPPLQQIQVGESATYSANYYDDSGKKTVVTTNTGSTWSLTSPSIGQVVSKGTYKGLSEGTSQVKVTYNGLSATAQLIVINDIPSVPPEPENNPPTVEIEGPTEVMTGEEFCLKANANDPDGDPLTYVWDYTGNGTLADEGGCLLSYDTPGIEKVTVTVNDGKDSDSDEHYINVIPPQPKANFSVSGTLKENRKVNLNPSHPYNGMDSVLIKFPMTEEKWTVTALDTVNQSAINSVQNINGNLSYSQVVDLLMKNAGDYKVTRYVKNSLGLEDTVETTITIVPDLEPVADFSTVTLIYRDDVKETDADTSKATIKASDMSYSRDDSIVKRIWTITYDSNNNGSFDDDTTEMLSDDNLTEISFTTNKVGKYKLELEVFEQFEQPTIAQFVDVTFDKARTDLRNHNTETVNPDEGSKVKPLLEKIVEVDNLAPIVSYEVGQQKTIDLQFDLTDSPFTREQIQASIPNLKNRLSEIEVVPNIKFVNQQRFYDSLAAGPFLSYGIKSDGTLNAAGDNRNYQTEVNNIKNVKQVVVGNGGVAFLKNDGNIEVRDVVDSYVLSYTDGDAIDAVISKSNLSVLKKDGTIANKFRYSFEEPNTKNWKNIVDLEGDGTNLFGLRSDGTVVTSNGDLLMQVEVNSWKNIIKLSSTYGNSLAVGLTNEGKVEVAKSIGGLTDENKKLVESWTNIIDIQATNEHILAITKDHKVLYAGVEMYQEFKGLSEWTDIIEIAASNHHNIGLKKDGTILASGRDAFDETTLPPKWSKDIRLEPTTQIAGFEESSNELFNLIVSNQSIKVNDWNGQLTGNLIGIGNENNKSDIQSLIEGNQKGGTFIPHKVNEVDSSATVDKKANELMQEIAEYIIEQMQEENKVDLVFGIGDTVHSDKAVIESKVNSIIIPKLNDVGIQVNNTKVENITINGVPSTGNLQWREHWSDGTLTHKKWIDYGGTSMPDISIPKDYVPLGLNTTGLMTSMYIINPTTGNIQWREYWADGSVNPHKSWVDYGGKSMPDIPIPKGYVPLDIKLSGTTSNMYIINPTTGNLKTRQYSADGSVSSNKDWIDDNGLVSMPMPDVPIPSGYVPLSFNVGRASIGTSSAYSIFIINPTTGNIQWREYYWSETDVMLSHKKWIDYGGTSMPDIPIPSGYYPLGLNSEGYSTSTYIIHSGTDTNFKLEETKNYQFVGIMEDKALVEKGKNALIREGLINNAYISGLGTSDNQSEFLDVISANMERGTFINNSNLDASLNAYADYIIKEIDKKRGTKELFITLDEEVKYFTSYNDFERDPKLQDRWKYEHVPAFFENDMGLIGNNQSYITNPITSFSKVGRYQPFYSAKDNPIHWNNAAFNNYQKWSKEANNWFIYVHRKPVPKFTPYVDSTTGEFTVKNEAYDLDKLSVDIGFGGGLKSQKWSWRIKGETWKEGLPNSPLNVDAVYEIKNTVVDFQNEEATLIKTISYGKIIEPTIELGFNKIQIYTAKSTEGLPVNISVDLGADSETVENEKVTLALYEKKSNEKVYSKEYTLADLKEEISFTIPSKYLTKNHNENYVAKFENYDSDILEVLNTSGSINTDGYTASEISLTSKLYESTDDLLYEGIVMTERIIGKEMTIYDETLTIETVKLKPKKTGYGSEMNQVITYTNDLKDLDLDIATSVYLDNDLIDSYLTYPKDGTYAVIDLVSDSQKVNDSGNSVITELKLPRVFVERKTGYLFSEEQKTNNDSRIQYELLDGGNQFYIPIWLDTLGKYNIRYESNDAVGTNLITFSVWDKLDIYAYMYAHIGSSTLEKDEILIEPVNLKNPFPDGLPNGWTNTDLDWLKK